MHFAWPQTALFYKYYLIRMNNERSETLEDDTGCWYSYALYEAPNTDLSERFWRS